jgi:oligopeptide/dipeptide ABC transporter ATP-binding protein
LSESTTLLLNVENLNTAFSLDEGLLQAVDDVSFDLYKGETLGMVGESGCGKSVSAQSIMRIVPPPGKISGKIFLYRRDETGREFPTDLAGLPPYGKEIRAIRGKEIAMIFQEPMTSFSPLHTIGFQIEEAIKLHRTKVPREAAEIALEMLFKVGIPNPEQNLNSYPHQLSGGMRQRAMIAMALSCNPALLIADEPTTALDVTVQAQILELMKTLQAERHMAIIYITHNLGVIAEMADRIAVMYLGQIVEYAEVDDIFFNPLHPYTVALLKSIPRTGKTSKMRLETIEGTVPLPMNLPKGCHFGSRCAKFMAGVCDAHDPRLTEVKNGHSVRCFLYSEVQKTVKT